MPAPFVAPLPIAVLDMEDGARLMLQVVGDGTDVEIGTRVDLVLRKYAHERGVPVYGYKARVRKGDRHAASWIHELEQGRRRRRRTDQDG